MLNKNTPESGGKSSASPTVYSNLVQEKIFRRGPVHLCLRLHELSHSRHLHGVEQTTFGILASFAVLHSSQPNSVLYVLLTKAVYLRPNSQRSLFSSTSSGIRSHELSCAERQSAVRKTVSADCLVE